MTEPVDKGEEYSEKHQSKSYTIPARPAEITEPPPSDWIVSTELTQHVVNKVSLLRDTSLTQPSNILIDGQDLTSYGTGTLQLRLEGSNHGRVLNMTVFGAAFVPRSRFNIVSIPALRVRRPTGTFPTVHHQRRHGDNVLSLLWAEGDHAIQAIQHEGRYHLTPAPSRDGPATQEAAEGDQRPTEEAQRRELVSTSLMDQQLQRQRNAAVLMRMFRSGGAHNSFEREIRNDAELQILIGQSMVGHYEGISYYPLLLQVARNLLPGNLLNGLRIVRRVIYTRAIDVYGEEIARRVWEEDWMPGTSL